MAYVDFKFYTAEYYGSQNEEVFNKNVNKACRKMDVFTTGIDGVKKLVEAFPETEYDSNAVKMCVCELVDLMAQIDREKQSAYAMNGVTEREDGTITNKIVSSVSSGTESITYATGSAGKSTAISEAIKSIKAENELYYSFINDALSGIADKNGVNLLYMGRYPFRLKHV